MPYMKVLNCKISRGAFSDERVFKLTLQSEEYKGIASRLHFWGSDNRRLDINEPALGQELAGKVTVRLIGKKGENAFISVPDDNVISVPMAQLAELPPEDS